MVGPDSNTWLQAVKESRSSFLRLKLGWRKDSGFLKNWRKACDSLVCAEGQVIQYTTIKARLYPTPAQAELFEKTFGCCRYLWNQMLADEQRFYWETGAHFIPTPAKYKKGAPFHPLRPGSIQPGRVFFACSVLHIGRLSQYFRPESEKF